MEFKKDAIKAGIEAGIITFFCADDAILCSIGNTTFLFGGGATNGMTIKEFNETFDLDAKTQLVWSTLNTIEDEDQAIYYDTILRCGLGTDKDFKPYLVHVRETYSRTFLVEAADNNEAREIVEDLLNQEVIKVSTETDYTDSETEVTEYRPTHATPDDVVTRHDVIAHFNSDYYD